MQAVVSNLIIMLRFSRPANEGIEKQNATLLAKWILSGAKQN
jgi:hypothetical protein